MGAKPHPLVFLSLLEPLLNQVSESLNPELQLNQKTRKSQSPSMIL